VRIEARDVSVVYGGRSRALDGVTLSVGVGECVAILGPTGSGKTTLLDVLAGLVTPTAGSASVEPGGRGAAHRRRVGLVAQFPEDQFFEERVADEVAFGLIRQGVAPDVLGQKVDAVLDRVSLDAATFRDREPTSLSAGEARRAAFASILVLERPFLLLDEPTAGLDPGTRESVVELLAAERDEGKGVVLVTHDLDVAWGLAERVVVLDRGRVVMQGPADDVLGRVRELVALGLEPPLEHRLVDALERAGSRAADPVRRVLLG
jgi:energy-coupling factor transporter ATP-binding protein EcfA2